MKIKESKWHVLFLLIIGIQIFPLIYMLSISFKSMDQIFADPLSIIPRVITFRNYTYIFENVDILRYIWNTFFISAAITFGKIITSILAGYILTFKNFKGKKILIFLILGTLFVPFTVTMIPNYLMISKIGLLNSSLGVILPQLADGMGIFMIIQNMKGIPKSILEVTKLDKIKETKVLYYIILPMIKNSIISMGILFFINSWNEYFWPLLILSEKKNYTLSLALQMFISSEGGNDWGVTMAIATLTIIFPIIMYAFFQKKNNDEFCKIRSKRIGKYERN
ncbi:MAG: carbohydrate ABC transporter permease [Cetobacterium somerae]|uniref:carbohydrate ABC transporter permease n=1 Tax=Cetobacterium somerae TaxID=188913 RepID=UPI003F3F02C7